MEVAKLVTQPFCRKQTLVRLYLRPRASVLAQHGRCCRARRLLVPWGRKHRGVDSGSTYVALEGALENKLLSHVGILCRNGINKEEVWGV